MAWCLVKHRDNFYFYPVYTINGIVRLLIVQSARNLFAEELEPNKIKVTLWRLGSYSVKGTGFRDSVPGGLLEISPFTTTYRPALGYIQPPLKWVQGMKWPEPKANSLCSSSIGINVQRFVSARIYSHFYCTQFYYNLHTKQDIEILPDHRIFLE
jgi:hypothetical protein